MKSALRIAFLLLYLVLVALVRCHNAPDVFVAGRICFVDADCYARMSRAALVLAHPGNVIRHQAFENHPDGVASHATAPMDYLIAGLAALLSPFSERALDLAGAFISPLLGVAAAAFLWFWSRGMPGRGALLTLYAISPILVHGTVLGRPDHQSLLILCLAVALGLERARPTRTRLQQTAGIAWGVALWVSLYEPLILLLAVTLLRVVFEGKSAWNREKFLALGVTVAVWLLIERGVRVSAPAMEFFPAWKLGIGELASIGPLSPVLFAWVGWGLLAAPILLGLRRATLPLLLLLLAVYGLSLWQIRWGYFLALVFVMMLPQLWSLGRAGSPPPTEPARRVGVTLLKWALFFASLWPVLADWDRSLFTDRTEARREAFRLADAAERVKGPFLAPWWFSPAIAYRSGQPGVGGSSHESLPGTVDTARFYLSTDPGEARAILERRKVEWVVAYEPSRTVGNAAQLLGKPEPEDAIGTLLWTRPHSPPRFLRFESDNGILKLFSVQK